MKAEIVLTKQYVHRLLQALEAGCIDYRHYIPWADQMIAKIEHPDAWLCNLAMTKLQRDAIGILSQFVYSEPFEEFVGDFYDYLGFLWIRYERRELSWASFLSQAGRYSDSRQGALECEYFYAFLNELEEKDFNIKTEKMQRAEVHNKLALAIHETKTFYQNFLKSISRELA